MELLELWPPELKKDSEHKYINLVIIHSSKFYILISKALINIISCRVYDLIYCQHAKLQGSFSQIL